MLAFLLAVSLAPAPALKITCAKPEIILGEAPAFSISISNKGNAPILVVQPNDGSDWHWRTPFTGWAVKPVADKSAWPATPPKSQEIRCGNMNGLSTKEVKDLLPGQSVNIDQAWLFQKPEFKEPGKYRVVFYYWHTNDNPVRGLEIPENDASVVDRIKSSQPYRLRSNEIVVTVKAQKQT